MPIFGALISRGEVVLAEWSQPGTNFPTIARSLASQIPSSPDSKNSYNYEGHNFNYLVEGGITYICMTDQDMKLRIPYAFLFDINTRFKTTYQDRLQTARSLAMNDSFSQILRDRMEFFSNDKNVDKISKIKGEIDDVRAIMVSNIDKVLERGERIEMLVSKTDDLNQQSRTFKTKSTALKKKMWWQNARYTCALVVIVSVIIIAIVLLVVWHFGLFSSHHHDTTDTTTGSPVPASTSTGDATTGILTTGIQTTAAQTTAVQTTAIQTTIASTAQFTNVIITGSSSK